MAVTYRLEAGAAPAVLLAGDKAVSGPGDIMISGGVPAVSGIGADGAVVRINGSVFAPGKSVIDLQGQAIDIALWSTAYVAGTNGIVAQTDNGKIQNFGSIGASDAGVALSDSAATMVSNTGAIVAGDVGLSALNSIDMDLRNYGVIDVTDAGGMGVILDGLGHVLNNKGRITASDTAVAVTSGTAKLINSGTLIADTGVATAGDLQLNNTGTILSAQAVEVSGIGLLDLVNRGTITGVVGGGGQNDRVLNTGDMMGGLKLGGGNDRFVNKGDLEGRADLGGGDDVANLMQATTGTRAAGGTGRDNLYGSQFDDVLSGGDQRDVLRGNDGDDRLKGGDARDLLTGGLGADDFIYMAASDSVGAGTDLIRDFERGQDRIDLRAVSADVMDFVGLGGFAGGGVASVGYDVRLTDSTAVVRVDADGDGTLDMRIFVKATGVMAADDFLL